MANKNNAPSTKVITGPRTRWSYANVWEPKSINGSDPKYSVSLIIPKDDTKTLEKIKAAFDRQPALANLLLDDFFKGEIARCLPAWRKVVAQAVLSGVPAPAFSSALAYYDGYRSASLPANLLQSQRDYFGAHTYERVDQPRGKFFHTVWTESGGDTVSGTYNA